MKAKCPYCRVEFDTTTALGRFIGDRVVHRWSGFYGTVTREHRVPGHVYVVWDGDVYWNPEDKVPELKEMPYDVDRLCRPMYAIAEI